MLGWIMPYLQMLYLLRMVILDMQVELLEGNLPHKDETIPTSNPNRMEQRFHLNLSQQKSRLCLMGETNKQDMDQA